MSNDTIRCENSRMSFNEETLRREVQRLKQQLEQLSSSGLNANDNDAAANNTTIPPLQEQQRQQLQLPPEKSGYLYKWADRSIGWGGTKWGLRFVRLEHGHFSYFKCHEDKSPRYILTLKNCAVRDEGSKANKRHGGFVQSSSHGETKKNSPKVLSSTATALTVASSSLSDASRNHYEEVEDELPNATSITPGSHFHVFSIYHRHSTAKTDDDNINPDNEKERSIIPLLRFSTQSYAEKMQWIDLISQSCAYCDSEEFAMLQQQQQQQTAAARKAQPHHQRGTLPPLIFESAPSYPPRTHIRNLSVGCTKNLTGKDFRSKASAKDAARTNNISYPPSKPMHRQASASYLASGGGGGDDTPKNYHGFFNLLLIILIVSNFRLLLDTVSRHGFILSELPSNPLEGFSEAPLADFPFVSGLLIVQAFVVGAYLIEKMLSRGWIGNWIGIALHVANTNASLGVVLAIIWYLIDHPVVGAILVLQATITWLKLISYVHANCDYRNMSKDNHRAMLAMVKDLDPVDSDIAYPQNVTLRDIYYFWFAPTLTYQIAFPRTPIVRWIKVFELAIQLLISTMLVIFLAAQVVAPNLDCLVRDLETNRGEFRTHVIGDYLLKLSISSTYIWLLVFYGFFHCFMNLTAEMLRFGDRGKLCLEISFRPFFEYVHKCTS